jgi:glycosyltransferase involved in cell wall biosynthesis
VRVRISLVVTTRNRSAQLAQSLRRWATLEAPEDGWELIVVDNGSTDSTRAVLDAHAGTLPLRIVHEPRRGAGRGHNAGWHAATGEIVAFIDDDCYPAPDFLVAVLRSFDEDSSLGFIGGMVLLHDEADYPITIQTSTRHKRLVPGEFLEAGVIHGANVSFRRTVLVAIGGYDPALGPGTPFTGDDIDAQCRALTAGFFGGYDPRIVVRHHHRRRGKSAADALHRRYDVGRGAYYARQVVFAPLLRYTYARNWYWKMRSQPRMKTLRELYGAGYYLLRCAVGLA